SLGLQEAIPMKKTLATDLALADFSGEAPPVSRRNRAPEYPQSVLDLPYGEARDSLLSVHEVLGAMLPARELAIYEAGGGSTSFLPFDVLSRAHVTVVDIDPEQIRNNDYADVKILGDIQTHRFASGSFDLITCYNVIEHLPDVEAALRGFCAALR